MPDISSNLGLNLPKGADTFDYDVFLRQNFQKIDDQLKPVATETFTATEGQSVFTLSNSYAPGKGELNVKVDGVPQILGSGYTETSTTSITLSEGLIAGQGVEVRIGGIIPESDARFSSIESSLADIVTNVKKYGAKCDGVTDDTSALQAAIDYVSGLGRGKVIIPANIYCAGTINLKTGVMLEGVGKITFKTGATTAIITPTPTLIALTQTTDIVKGDKTNNIANSLNVGDFITYRSSARFTEDWDQGTEIRSYYTKGEIHKVVAATASQVTFAGASSFDLPVSSSVQVEAFTPTKNIGIKNISVTRAYDETTTSDAILIQYCDGVEIENVYTENTNRYGIGLSKSRNINVNNWSGKGGYHGLGLNYGIAIIDGTKNVNIAKATGEHFRHVITGGGSGYAPPIGAVADSIFGSDNDPNNASLDCHGIAMNFTYKNAYVDNGMDINGVGHTIENIQSANGFLMSSEGGRWISFRNIKMNKCTKFQLTRASKNIRYENVEIYMSGTKNTYHASPQLKDGDSIYYKNVKIINLDAKSGMTTTQLDATVNSNAIYGFAVWSPNSVLENIWIEGFPIAIQLGAENIKIKGLHIRNCGWKGAVVASPVVIGIYLDSVNLTIDQITFGWYLTALAAGSGYRFIEAAGNYIRTPAPANCKGLNIQHMRYVSNHQKNFYSNDMVVTSAYVNSLINAFEIPNVSSITTGTGTVVSNQWNG